MTSKEDSLRAEVRERVWNNLRPVAEPDSRFAWDFAEYIPDYEGSDEGAQRLFELANSRNWDQWLVTPDNNLSSLREILIEEDVPFIMPSSGIRRGFLFLDPNDVPDERSKLASVLDGTNQFANEIPIEELEGRSSLDIMVTGASFVTTDGLRMGKGHGYFDLEWAMLQQIGLVSQETAVVAAVHDEQIVNDESIDTDELMEPHDTIVDYIVTPTQTIEIEATKQKPDQIYWELLSEEEIKSIPPLSKLRERQDGV